MRPLRTSDKQIPLNPVVVVAAAADGVGDAVVVKDSGKNHNIL